MNVKNKACPVPTVLAPRDRERKWQASSPCVPGGNPKQSEQWACQSLLMILLSPSSRWPFKEMISSDQILWISQVHPTAALEPSSEQADAFPLLISLEVKLMTCCPWPQRCYIRNITDSKLSTILPLWPSSQQCGLTWAIRPTTHYLAKWD